MLRATSNCMEFILTAGREYFHTARTRLALFLRFVAFIHPWVCSNGIAVASLPRCLGFFTRMRPSAREAVLLTICGILPAAHCLKKVSATTKPNLPI